MFAKGMLVCFSWLSMHYSFSIKKLKLILLETNALIREDILASKGVKEVTG